MSKNWTRTCDLCFFRLWDKLKYNVQEHKSRVLWRFCVQDGVYLDANGKIFLKIIQLLLLFQNLEIYDRINLIKLCMIEWSIVILNLKRISYKLRLFFPYQIFLYLLSNFDFSHVLIILSNFIWSFLYFSENLSVYKLQVSLWKICFLNFQFNFYL